MRHTDGIQNKSEKESQKVANAEEEAVKKRYSSFPVSPNKKEIIEKYK
jgi:hypothetical protein